MQILFEIYKARRCSVNHGILNLFIVDHDGERNNQETTTKHKVPISLTKYLPNSTSIHLVRLYDSECCNATGLECHRCSVLTLKFIHPSEILDYGSSTPPLRIETLCCCIFFSVGIFTWYTPAYPLDCI